MVYHFFSRFFIHNPSVLVVLLLTPCVTVIEYNIVPYGLKLLVDALNTNTDISTKQNVITTLYYPILFIISAWLMRDLISRFCYYLEIHMVPNLQKEIRLYCLNHVMAQPYNFFLNNLSGDIASRINNLPQSCERMRQLICWNIVASLIVVCASSFMLLQIGYQFVLILMCWVVTHLIIIYYFLSKIEHSAQHHTRQESKLNGLIVDMIANILSFKSFIHEENNRYVTQQQGRELKTHKLMMKRIWLFQVVSDIPIAILLISTLCALMNSWANGETTAGDFILVFNIVVAVMNVIVCLGHVLTDIFRELGKIKESLKIITTNSNIDKNMKKTLNLFQGEIKFKDVSFAYNEQNMLFQNLNLAIKPGKKTLITGASGSGKSTLLKLLFRFYDPHSGIIEIDQQDIKFISEESIRAQITYIPQNINLFHRSIKENIIFGVDHRSDEEIIKAAKNAQCHEFITQLPNQYDTLIGEGGHSLSGGQRQRIAIARAILKDSKIIIFDEVTSAQDKDTEKLIFESLESIFHGRTLIFISHSPASLRFVDEIIYL